MLLSNPRMKKEFRVACLCALWCDSCVDYRAGFEALAAEFPQADFVWLDVEDDAEEVGDLEVENFPTIQVKRGEKVLFYGVQLPVHEHLRRLLQEIFLRESSSQSSPG
jgi:thiol-disulfide isomerase/thioredoxin